MYDVYRRQQQKYPGRSMTKNMLATVGIGGAAGAAAGYGLGRTIYNKRSQKFLSALSNARKEQLFQLADRSPEQKAFLKATRAMMNQAKKRAKQITFTGALGYGAAGAAVGAAGLYAGKKMLDSRQSKKSEGRLYEQNVPYYY